MSAGSGTIVNSNGYCLDTLGGSTANETPVVLYECNASSSQQWRIDTSSGVIVNVQSGLCLDDKYSGATDGNPIWIHNCNGTSAEKWITPLN